MSDDDNYSIRLAFSNAGSSGGDLDQSNRWQWSLEDRERHYQLGPKFEQLCVFTTRFWCVLATTVLVCIAIFILIGMGLRLISPQWFWGFLLCLVGACLVTYWTPTEEESRKERFQMSVALAVERLTRWFKDADTAREMALYEHNSYVDKIDAMRKRGLDDKAIASQFRVF